VKAWAAILLVIGMGWLEAGRQESAAARQLRAEEQAAGEFAYALRVWRESQKPVPDFGSVPR
jgi:hypothetical protein